MKRTPRYWIFLTMLAFATLCCLVLAVIPPQSTGWVNPGPQDWQPIIDHILTNHQEYTHEPR